MGNACWNRVVCDGNRGEWHWSFQASPVTTSGTIGLSLGAITPTSVAATWNRNFHPVWTPQPTSQLPC